MQQKDSEGNDTDQLTNTAADKAMKEAQQEWQTEAREAAKGYGALGYPVFKVHSIIDGRCTCGNSKCGKKSGKHPRTVGWQQRATSGVDFINLGWLKEPDSNIGIPTGEASGILVLDIDLSKAKGQPSGEDSLADLIQIHGGLPETVEAITGSGGRHLIFQHPPYPLNGRRVGIMPGLDIRADGNLIVAPPSKHMSGNTYMWKPGHGLGEIDLAPAPEWLLALIKEKSNGDAGSGNDWVKLAAQGVAEGERNVQLAAFAGHLFGKKVHPYVAFELLLAWNKARCVPPLEDEESITTINSIAGRELSKLKGE